MTTQFYDGQNVEVCGESIADHAWDNAQHLTKWTKGKIVCLVKWGTRMYPGEWYSVEFADGSSAVFDAEYLRIDTPRGNAAIHPMDTLR